MPSPRADGPRRAHARRLWDGSPTCHPHGHARFPNFFMCWPNVATAPVATVLIEMQLQFAIERSSGGARRLATRRRPDVQTPQRRVARRLQGTVCTPSLPRYSSTQRQKRRSSPRDALAAAADEIRAVRLLGWAAATSGRAIPARPYRAPVAAAGRDAAGSATIPRDDSYASAASTSRFRRGARAFTSRCCGRRPAPPSPGAALRHYANVLRVAPTSTRGRLRPAVGTKVSSPSRRAARPVDRLHRMNFTT